MLLPQTVTTDDMFPTTHVKSPEATSPAVVITTQDWLLTFIQDRPSANVCIWLCSYDLLLLWPWPDDLDIQTWPRYSEGVPVHQKWSF